MDNLSKLDKVFLQECTPERIKEEFHLYRLIKTDTLIHPPEINIHIGADGITHEVFSKTLNHQADFIVKRLHQGNYFFYPFRELVISKDPKIKSPRKALELGKERILSIASIRDVLVQKIIYDFIYPIVEKRFTDLPLVSFGYRKNMNAPKAARKIYKDINEGYTYALDADLEKFFDTIPQNLLVEQIEGFLGDSKIISKLLYRFIHVDRVEWGNYKGNTDIFKHRKPFRSKRIEGIPQGGILSGLLANMYLHQFDEWVIKELSNEIPLRYTRYADDFIILTKNESELKVVMEKCYSYLKLIGLNLHKSPEKTRMVDLTKKGKYINFVGFAVSQTRIQIQKQNIEKFKERIREILQKTSLNDIYTLNLLKLRLDYKYLGNEMKQRVCENCGHQEVIRNWLSFFLTITDVQQLRSIDSWINQEINRKYYLDTNQRLERTKFKPIGFLSLEEIYYRYRKLNANKSICTCSPFEQKFIETRNPYEEILGY